jgi:hypothetical protein
MAEEVEHWPNKHKALSSNHSTARKRKSMWKSPFLLLDMNRPQPPAIFM